MPAAKFALTTGVVYVRDGGTFSGPLTISSGPLTLSSGQFLAPDGTAAAPSYSFTNGTDKGFYSSGTNEIGIAATGVKVANFSFPSGASSTSQFLNITGTLPATLTAATRAITFAITGAGSSAQTVTLLRAVLSAGYTGANSSIGANVINSSAGTGAVGWTGGNANYGTNTSVSGSGAGHNVGMLSTALQSSTLNLGMLSHAISGTNTPALNVGMAGLANNGTVNVGGFFGLTSAAPTLTVSAALTCDNGSQASDIFRARDAGTAVVRIADGGDMYLVGGALLVRTLSALTDGAAAQAGTLLNAPAAGNPTKWIAIDDNGTTRYIPTW